MTLWARLLIAGAAIAFALALSLRSPKDRHLRGRKLDVNPKGRRHHGTGEPRGVRWGSETLLRRAENQHFLVIGTTGSGKTLTIHRLMADVLPRIGVEPDQRAVVYDPKQDVLPFLQSLDLRCPVRTLDPFDGNGAAWDVAKDVNSPALALQLAFDLIAKEQKEGGYFIPAARDVLWGLVMSLCDHCGENWTLRDVVLATRSWERLKRLLYTSSQGRERFDTHLGRSERQGAGVIGTIRANLASLEVVAALWEHAPEKVSLTEWSTSDYVLVLGNNEMARASLDVLNRLMLRRITQLVLAQQESAERRTWLFLDEVRDAAELDALPAFLTKARSKGGCAVLGYQDNDGMKQVYGNYVAEELMAMCSHKAILRLESPSTAKWASSLFGEHERIELRESVNGAGPLRRGQRTRSEQRVKADVVMPSEFMSIPPTDARNGLTGYYLTPFASAPFRDTAPLAEFVATPRHSGTAETREFVPRGRLEQHLEPWCEADVERLGMDLGLELELVPEEGEPALQLG